MLANFDMFSKKGVAQNVQKEANNSRLNYMFKFILQQARHLGIAKQYWITIKLSRDKYYYRI